MYFCSAGIAALSLVGPISILILLLFLRSRIAAAVRYVLIRLPRSTHFLVVPVLAGLCFTLSWAPMHFEISSDQGLVSHRTFPAIVAIFAFVVARHGPSIQRWLQKWRFFDRRDRIHKSLRFAVALLIPLLVSLFITFQVRVTQTALKEQVIVIFSLCTGYLALTPREGRLGTALQRRLAKSHA